MKRKLFTLFLAVMLVLFAAGFVSCSEKELSASSDIKYDGSTITWSCVENADGYKIKINDESEKFVTTNSYSYTDGGEFSVTVIAVSNKRKISDSPATKESFFPLGSVDGIFVGDDGAISWNKVENADGYEITINGATETLEENRYTGVGAGVYEIQVRPLTQNDSYYTSRSDIKTVTILEAVLAKSITYSDGKIRWEGVPGALCYEVRVNGELVGSDCTSTEILYQSNNTPFEVSIRAIGNGTDIFSGAMSELKKFGFLPKVTGVRVENGILLWDAVEGASGYKVKINGSVKEEVFTECKFENLEIGVDNAVSVMAVCDDDTRLTSWSEESTVHLLGAPSIRWNGGAEPDGVTNSIAWEFVLGAVGYEVWVIKPDGTEDFSVYGENQKSFTYEYRTAGVYTVAVRALASDSDNSKCSSAYSDSITVNRLAAPEKSEESFIVSDARDAEKGFTVTFKQVSAATAYRLYKDGIEYSIGTETQFAVAELKDLDITETQSYSFCIQSVGGVETVDGRVCVTLPSVSTESLKFEIKVLAMPSDVNISDFYYTFSAVEDNCGYVVDIDGNTYGITDAFYDIGTLDVGNHSIRVYAQGNGSDVLSSGYTAPISVVRLAAPTNIRVDTSDASEGALYYDEVQLATDYEVIFDNLANTLSVSEISDIGKYIEKEGTTVCMQSVANYYNSEKTVYYMSSRCSDEITLVKLAAPTFGEIVFTNTQLGWQASDNTDPEVYTPTYRVYNSDGTLYKSETNEMSVDIASLAGGRSYTFYVKAIGNGKDYINSENSISVTIHKLSSPAVVRESGRYVWERDSNAEGYAVYVDGEDVSGDIEVSGGSYSYTPDFTELKNYTVQFIAIGDGGIDTIDSDPTVIEQKTKQLVAPEFKISYSEESYSPDGYIKVEITGESENANGYSYAVGDSTLTSDELVYAYKPESEGTFIASVCALGGDFDKNGVYCLDSLPEIEIDSEHIIIILEAPNPEEIGMNEDGCISWTPIGYAVKYEIKFSLNGWEYDTVSEFTEDACYYVLDPEAALSLTMCIRAVGDGDKIITSGWVEVILR